MDLFVAGYSGDGRLRFALSGGQPLDESGTGVASYLDGGFLVAGFAPRPGSGNEIAFERLDALPHARYCIDCKQREEDAKK